MSKRNEMPERVPVLSAEMICKGTFGEPDGRRCLGGWRFKVFGFANHSSAGELARKTLAEACSPEGVFVWNDEHSPAECADLWNRTMESLGYSRVDDHFVLKEPQ